MVQISFCAISSVFNFRSVHFAQENTPIITYVLCVKFSFRSTENGKNEIWTPRIFPTIWYVTVMDLFYSHSACNARSMNNNITTVQIAILPVPSDE